MARAVTGRPVSRARSWMEACLKEELPPPVELEESLRNGVLLAKLGHCFAPSVVPLKKIYDIGQLRYQVGAQVPPSRSSSHTAPLAAVSRVAVSSLRAWGLGRTARIVGCLPARRWR